MGNHSGGFFLHSLSMTTKLKNYFPMIRSREEILKEIDGSIKLTEKFYSWGDAARQEFLDFCTGVRGVKLLYDSFFKEIMNPETVPERLKDLALIPGWRWIFCRIAKMNTI